MVNLLLILSFLFTLPFSDATSCYRCTYVEGIKIEPEVAPSSVSGEPFTIHYSCASGKKPKDKFLVNCESWYNSQKSKNTSISETQNNSFSLLNGIPSSINVDDTNVTFGCIKVNFDGHLRFSGAKAFITVRGCIPIYNSQETIPDKCYEDTEKAHIKDVIKEATIKEWIQEDNFNDETEIGVCTCNTDECNGAMRSVSFKSLFFITVFVQIFYFFVNSSDW